MLPSIGPTEIIVLLVSLGIWAAGAAFVVFVARAIVRKTGQDRTIATLVEENRRLRETLDEHRRENA